MKDESMPSASEWSGPFTHLFPLICKVWVARCCTNAKCDTLIWNNENVASALHGPNWSSLGWPSLDPSSRQMITTSSPITGSEERPDNRNIIFISWIWSDYVDALPLPQHEVQGQFQPGLKWRFELLIWRFHMFSLSYAKTYMRVTYVHIYVAHHIYIYINSQSTVLHFFV